MFNLNKNTLYNDGLLRWRTELQEEPILEAEIIKLKIGKDD